MVDVDQELMRTGDILIGRRFSGDAAEQMILSGGYASHVAMIVEDARGGPTKYVIDCPTDMGLLNRTGVRKTELNEWLGLVLAEDYDIAWLPLDKNLRAFGDLNVDNLNFWFNQVEGSMYSEVHDFFASVDTPDQSFPAPLNAESFPINLRLYYKFAG